MIFVGTYMRALVRSMERCWSYPWLLAGSRTVCM